MLTVVEIDNAPHVPRKERIRRLRDIELEAEHEVYKALHRYDLLESDHISPGADPAKTRPMNRLLSEWWTARIRYEQYLEGQIVKLERAVRNVLASDLPSDDDRERLSSLLYTKNVARQRDAKLLSAHEADIVQQYRDTDSEGKEIVRKLCARLTVNPEGGA